jgi:hypothetical protein
MHKTLLPILSPCTEDWDAMEGDARRRACQKCSKEVINLSAMTDREVARLLRRPGQQELCVRYHFDDEGAVELRAEPFMPLIPAAVLTRGRGAVLGASLAVAALTACNPAGPVGDALVARTAISAAAAKLGASGTCSASMEPVLPLEVRLLTAACAPSAVATPPLHNGLGEPPQQPAQTPASEPAPPPPAPAPPVLPAPLVDPAPRPAPQPKQKGAQKPERYPHKLMGKVRLPPSSSLME